MEDLKDADALSRLSILAKTDAPAFRLVPTQQDETKKPKRIRAARKKKETGKRNATKEENEVEKDESIMEDITAWTSSLAEHPLNGNQNSEGDERGGWKQNQAGRRRGYRQRGESGSWTPPPSPPPTK